MSDSDDSGPEEVEFTVNVFDFKFLLRFLARQPKATSWNVDKSAGSSNLVDYSKKEGPLWSKIWVWWIWQSTIQSRLCFYRWYAPERTQSKFLCVIRMVANNFMKLLVNDFWEVKLFVKLLNFGLKNL